MAPTAKRGGTKFRKLSGEDSRRPRQPGDIQRHVYSAQTRRVLAAHGETIDMCGSCGRVRLHQIGRFCARCTTTTPLVEVNT